MKLEFKHAEKKHLKIIPSELNQLWAMSAMERDMYF